MRTHILADDVVHVDLTAEEHVALAGAIRELVAELHPDDVRSTLGLTAASARAFAHSLAVLEHQARLAGIGWLSVGAESAGETVFTAVFDVQGCSWRLTLEQLLFVEACAAEEHRRGERERRVSVNAA